MCISPVIVALLLAPCAHAQDQDVELLKSREAAPISTDARIDWAQAERAMQRSEVRASPRHAELMARVDRVDLPVLLPASSALLESATIVSDHGWYSASLSDGRRSIAIFGSALAVELPELSSALRDLEVDPRGYRETVTDGITTLSFVRFGVSYDIDIECIPQRRPTPDTPLRPDDERATITGTRLMVGGTPCITDEEADLLVRSLEVVGGHR